MVMVYFFTAIETLTKTHSNTHILHIGTCNTHISIHLTYTPYMHTSYTYTCIYICTHPTYTHICMHTTHLYTNKHIHMYTRTTLLTHNSHTHNHTHTHTCEYAHTNTYPSHVCLSHILIHMHMHTYPTHIQPHICRTHKLHIYTCVCMHTHHTLHTDT